MEIKTEHGVEISSKSHELDLKTEHDVSVVHYSFKTSRQNRFHDSALINTPSNPAKKNSKKALELI